MDVSDLGQLAVGGVPIAVFVFVIVQALKWSGMLKSGNQIRVGVLVVSMIGAMTWSALELFPQISGVLSVLFQALVGVAGATLAYEGLERMRSGSGS